MLTTGSNQYLQPDYLSPLPTTLDAKKSPLALLAQTCSQIGADSPPTKPLIPPLEKSKKSSSNSSGGGSTTSAPPPATASAANDSSPAPDSKGSAPVEKSAPRASPAEPRLAFKPYEANVLTKKAPEERPPSSKSGASAEEEKKASPRAPSRKSVSPAAPPAPSASAPATPAADSKADRKSSSPGGASPIIRSGLEILQGHPKDLPLGTYKGPLSAGLGGALGGSLGALCAGCPPGLEASNPAFRPPFAGAAGPFAHHHAAMLAASAYPPGAAPGPYVSYARVKTAGGGEALVPVCKDPYCTGCQYSAAHQQLLLGAAAAAAAAACPSGCTQCDHQKYATGLSLQGLVPPGPVAPPLSYSQQLGRPYVCNWIAGDSYCGKRFASSDELLQHLRSHTALGAAAADSAAAAAAAAAGPMSSLLSPHSFLSGGLHRAGYPTPPLSPLSAAAARYHPYSKPGGALPPSLAASPFSAFNPTALGPYYSPYALYGQRMGAAAVHP